MILPALMFGYGFTDTVIVTAVGALVVGAIVAPFTRRAEVRALAARPGSADS